MTYAYYRLTFCLIFSFTTCPSGDLQLNISSLKKWFSGHPSSNVLVQGTSFRIPLTASSKQWPMERALNIIKHFSTLKLVVIDNNKRINLDITDKVYNLWSLYQKKYIYRLVSGEDLANDFSMSFLCSIIVTYITLSQFWF